MPDTFSYLNNANGAYVESLYDTFREDPDAVDAEWRRFFEGYEFSKTALAAPIADTTTLKEVAVSKLINAYRARGHLMSNTNPIRERRKHKADLELSYFGLSEADLETEFESGHEIKIGRASLANILAHLNATYCGSIGVEFMYSRHPQLRQWLYTQMETHANRPNLTSEQKRRIFEKIDQAATFEHFLQTKYVGKKRFSLEGIEALIPALDTVINTGADLGVEELILGMAHRGRLNVLVNVFGKDYAQVFSEFEGTQLPAGVKGDGDVKYHLGHSADVMTPNGKPMHLALAANPSHLEAVNPVVQGMVQAKLQNLYGNETRKIIPVFIHGDAALAGQGVNYEVVQMSNVPGYASGGALHIVLNNQIGFTTSFHEARSSVYCTALAKITESPVFHVNADDPESVVHAIDLAVRIRQEFGIDVYVDILGYRRYGHNEGDEPRFTQPGMYSIISQHDGIRTIYLNKLLAENLLTEDEAEAITSAFKDTLQKKLDAVRKKKAPIAVNYLKRLWEGLRVAKPADFEKSITTGVKKAPLTQAAKALSEPPKDFKLYSKSQKVFENRRSLFFENKQVDWAMAELLAYGTLLTEGHAIRLSGQDCQRGTFSHRHAVVKDEAETRTYVPVNHIQESQSKLQIYNSILSEYAVLGFEYGYSLAQPNALVIWEAQFGDFSNGAQIIIDQFISSSESKWQRMSGLTLFLPHGYEGQGPEHSSARLERYLQLCAEDNMYVVNATTPANFFHLLRRQVHNPFRIPLIVMTPKSLLRHPDVISPVSELEKGHFQELIPDESVTIKRTRRVLLCSGKIYYDLKKYRDQHNIKDTAIVRLEQLYPLPHKQLAALKKSYAGVKEWRWVQEEPANMGAWSHILRHFPEFECISREPGASPATGYEYVHLKEQAAVVSAAFTKG